MAVVPDNGLLPPGAYEETWLDHKVPWAGILFREVKVETNTADTGALLRTRQVDAKANFELIKWWLKHCEHLQEPTVNIKMISSL